MEFFLSDATQSSNMHWILAQFNTTYERGKTFCRPGPTPNTGLTLADKPSPKSELITEVTDRYFTNLILQVIQGMVMSMSTASLVKFGFEGFPNTK